MLVLHSMCKGFLKFQDHESFDYVNQTVEKELWCDTWHLCGAKSLFGHSWRVSLRCQYIAFSLHLCRRLFFGCQLACSPLIATTLWALIISRQKIVDLTILSFQSCLLNLLWYIYIYLRATAHAADPSVGPARTHPERQPPGDGLKTAKHHLNPDANIAKNPPPQGCEVTSLKPLKEKKQAPARRQKTRRNLARTRPERQPPGDGLKTAKHHLNPDANIARNRPQHVDRKRDAT